MEQSQKRPPSEACPPIPRWKKYLYSCFSLDLRVLSIFRLLVATWLLFDLFQRLGDAELLYSDSGVLPRDWSLQMATVELNSWWWFSPFQWSGEAYFVLSLLAIQAILACLLLIGYQTRVVTPLCWFLALSLHVRNPMVCYGADHLIRLFLFWCMFLPWGARYSVQPSEESTPSLHPAGIALIFQILTVVTVAGWEKTLPDWVDWGHGTALHTALSAVTYETPIGRALAQELEGSPSLVAWLTALVVLWERLFPLLFLASRKLAALSLGLFALALALNLSIGLWPLALLAAAVVLVPGSPLPAPQRKFPEYTIPLLLLAGLSLAHAFWFRPLPLTTALAKFGLAQKWELFARLPHDDGWPDIVLRQGETTTRPLGEWEGTRPESVPSHCKNIRWRRYFLKLFQQADYAPLQTVFCDTIRRDSSPEADTVELWWYHRAHGQFQNRPFQGELRWNQNYGGFEP